MSFKPYICSGFNLEMSAQEETVLGL